MAVSTFTKAGTKASTPAKLNKNIFGLEVKNHQLLKDAYLSYQAGARSAGAKTKRRGEVRGSTAKPWRQKGTGNARFGSKYNPIWRGGGVAFGPTGEQNFTRKLNVKAKHQALRQALSLANQSDKLIIIEDFLPSDGKVKAANTLLGKIGATGRTLIILDEKNDVVERATRNLEKVKALPTSRVSVFELLNADKVVISKKALESMEKWLGGKNE